MEEEKNTAAELHRIKVQQALLDFLEQEPPIFLKWSDRIIKSEKQTIEVFEVEGKTTYSATFLLSEIDIRILIEAQKGELETYFVFKGQNFVFEMAINPNKMLMDNGVISLFSRDLSKLEELDYNKESECYKVALTFNQFN